MPRSSCAALLKTLFELNMVSTDRRKSSYFPTAKFAELGGWLSAENLYPESLLLALQTLAEETGETITLAAYNDLMLELVHVKKSRQAISFSAERGQKFPVWRTALGTAFLANRDNSQIKTLYRRAVDRRQILENEFTVEEILWEVDRARELGYAFARGIVYPDGSAIARNTGLENNGRQLIVAVAGPTHRLETKVRDIGHLLIETID